MGCDRALVEIRQPEERVPTTEHFEIKTKYPDGEITARYNITVTPCKDPNCRFCHQTDCDDCLSRLRLDRDRHSCSLQIGGRPIPIPQAVYRLTVEVAIAQAAAGLGVMIGFLTALVTGTSSQDAWSIVHYLQIIMFLPLMINTMDGRLRDLIVSNAFFALSSYSLPAESVESLFIRNLAFEQPDEYLGDIGWSSGSTLVNSYLLIVFVIFYFIVIVTLKLIAQLLYRSISSKTSMFDQILLKVSRMSPLAMLARIMFEVYMITCLMAVSELKYYFTNGGKNNFGYQEEGEQDKVRGNYISSLISFCILILAFCTVVFTYLLFKNNGNMARCRNFKVCTFSKTMNTIPNVYISRAQDSMDNINHDDAPDWTQKVKAYRLYSFLFLARRMIAILVLVLIPDSKILAGFKVSCLLVLQATYAAYAVLFRSFGSIKDQIVEAYNEIVTLVLMIL